MLVQDHEPLEHRCRTLWSLAAAVSAAVVMVVASGLRLDAAVRRRPTIRPPPRRVQAAAPKVERRSDLEWTGH